MNRRSIGNRGFAEPLESRAYFSPTVMFSQPILYPTGTYPSAVVTADLTGDGDQYVITSNYGAASIAVLPGNGTGTLGAPVFYPVGSAPEALATGDLNGDGIPDVVVANSGSNDVSVLFGNGDGTLQSQVTYATGLRPESVAVTDLTGDGHLDIITANQGSNSVSVLINNGDGTFAPAVSYPCGIEPDGLAVGDLNGDERPDIVTVNPTNSNVHVLLNRGNGTFKPSGIYSTGANGRGVTIADVNNDGRPDILTSNLHDSSISILLNNGDGTFQDNQDTGVGSFPFSIAVADLNGDNRPDIITATNYNNSVGVIVHIPGGGFNPLRGFAAGQSPVDVVVADLNNDGRPDLISANFNDNTVSVNLNQTVFVPLIPTTISLTASVNPVQSGNSVRLTATVTPGDAAKPALMGTVQFFNGDAVIGVAHIGANGIAHAQFKAPLGDSSVTAVYTGNAKYAAVTSAVLSEQGISASTAAPFVSPEIVGANFPSVFVPTDRGTVSVALTNQTAGLAKGTVGVQLYASADGQLDSTAIALDSTPSTVAINLLGGTSRVVNLGFTFPANLFQPGTYTIFAALTPVTGFAAEQVSAVPVMAAATVQAALEFGKIGTASQPTLTRIENGSLVTFTLNGPGFAVLSENSDGSITVALSNTSAGTSLSIASTKAVTIDNLASTGGMKSVTATTATLIGIISIPGGVRQLTLAGESGGIIRLGPGRPATLALGMADALTLSAAQPIRSMSVDGWSNSNGSATTSISQFIDAGDFSGVFAAINFGSVRIDGSISNGDILGGADGFLGSGGDFFGPGSIASLEVAGSISDSVIAAGLAPLGDDLLGAGTKLQRGKIGAVFAGGTIDEATKILAQTLPATARIGGASVSTKDDPRFQLPG